MTRKITDEELKEWSEAIRNMAHGAWNIEKKEAPKPMPNAQAPMFQAKLDLHGLTLERAHKKFLEFMYHAIIDGLKNVLVITGKGNPGKLRQELPHWCEADYLRPYVSSCKIAEKKHGGDGAFEIKLKN